MENYVNNLTPRDLQSQFWMNPSGGSTWNYFFEIKQNEKPKFWTHSRAHYALQV